MARIRHPQPIGAGDLFGCENDHGSFAGNSGEFNCRNVLVFKYTEDGSRQFQVYQLSGSAAKFAGEASLDFGPLGSADNLGPMTFHRGDLYVLGNLKSAGADGSRLIRVPLAGPAK